LELDCWKPLPPKGPMEPPLTEELLLESACWWDE